MDVHERNHDIPDYQDDPGRSDNGEGTWKRLNWNITRETMEFTMRSWRMATEETELEEHKQDDYDPAENHWSEINDYTGSCLIFLR